MSQYAMLFNADRCVGCQSCEVACQSENQLPAWLSLIRIVQIGPIEVGGKLRYDFKQIRCMHCAKAHCIEACPEKALTRGEQGVVSVNEELCTGCKVCIEVCPFAAPQFNPDKGIVEMCNLCSNRLEKGFTPACAKACLAEALVFSDASEITKRMQDQKVVKV